MYTFSRPWKLFYLFFISPLQNKKSYDIIARSQRGIVQSVEHQSPKLGVVGSSPPAPAKKKAIRVSEWLFSVKFVPAEWVKYADACEIACGSEIRLRRMKERILFHIDQSRRRREIFHNFRRKLFHIRRKANISLEKHPILWYNNGRKAVLLWQIRNFVTYP